jgi:hypothetical protein
MVRGSCLCGDVRFGADAIEILTHCHCSMCRKAHGAAFATFGNAYETGFRWVAGEDRVAHYRSSPDNARAFCPRCGSNLPYTNDDIHTWVIPAGALDDDPGVRPVLHTFTGSKAPWHEIADDLPAFETWVPGYGPSDEEDA